jgi:hypothetical protein
MTVTITRRRLLYTVGLIALLVVVGVAYASWTTSGEGDGTAKGGTLAPLQVQNAPGRAIADLFPDNNGSLVVDVGNPNDGALTLTTINPGGPVVSGNPIACPSSNVSLIPTSGLSIALPAHASTQLTIPNIVDMAHDAPTGCQGVVFTIPVVVVGST